MKNQLTKEQSQHLIDLGVPKEKASRTETIKHGQVIAKDSLGNTLSKIGEYVPIFTLTDLIKILPKEIGHHSCISIGWNFITEKWDVDYDCTQGSWHGAKELIDALYELACWYYETKE